MDHKKQALHHTEISQEITIMERTHHPAHHEKSDQIELMLLHSEYSCAKM